MTYHAQASIYKDFPKKDEAIVFNFVLIPLRYEHTHA